MTKNIVIMVNYSYPNLFSARGVKPIGEKSLATLPIWNDMEWTLLLEPHKAEISDTAVTFTKTYIIEQIDKQRRLDDVSAQESKKILQTLGIEKIAFKLGQLHLI